MPRARDLPSAVTYDDARGKDHQMRQLVVLCSWVMLAAACSSADLPSASPTSTATAQLIRAPATFRPSPTVVVFTVGRVEIGDNFYAPQEITVIVGATVTWQISQGENEHDVVSMDSLFRSNSPMTRGVDMFTFTFTTPGEYGYVCSYHIPEGMVGKIIVVK